VRTSPFPLVKCVPIPIHTIIAFPLTPSPLQVRYWLFGPETGKKVVNYLLAISLFVQTSELDRSHSRLIHPFINLEGCSARSRIAWPPCPLVWYVCTCIHPQFPNKLSIDLYGRGYSDAPEITYDASLYATQLALLMQHVKWPKAYVAGVSMVRTPFI
jgi:hypothetical protein